MRASVHAYMQVLSEARREHQILPELELHRQPPKMGAGDLTLVH